MEAAIELFLVELRFRSYSFAVDRLLHQYLKQETAEYLGAYR